MAVYKIFISSPGDVGRERHLAEQVIRRVEAEFHDRVEVQPYFWEYEPMDSTRDYQENIPLTSDFDLVICILWKRLGSELSVKHKRPDGGRWRSGTEFELVTAVESKKARGTPDIFIFKNDTKVTFEAEEAGKGAKVQADLDQWKELIAFIEEWSEGVQDGQRIFTAALNRYQTLDQFEQVLEKLLRGKLKEHFPAPSDPPGSEPKSLPAPMWTEGSPFRGLEAFQFLHAPVFCGRTHAIGEVLDRLRRKAAQGRPFVLILGASGSGKSSLAMAGVLPLLVKPGTIEGVGLWRRLVFRPGGQTEVGDLFDRLAAALVRRQQEDEGLLELISGNTTVEQLAADLRADPKAAALLVRSALNQVAVLHREAEAQKLASWIAESQAENRTVDVERYGRLLADLTPREARLALVVDQAEELFTSDDLNRRPELRSDFAVALNALAESGVVFVLATLPSIFYPQIQQLPAFVDLKEADGQFDVLPAQPAEITQMIRQPAIAAGLRFEKNPQTHEGLDEVLADEVKAEPRLLPLLEFALDELYKRRTADGLLTFEAYRLHLGGSIVLALAKRADATLEGLHELSRNTFRSVMLRLATTVDDTAAGSEKVPQLDVIEKESSDPVFQRQRVFYNQLTARPPGAKALVDAFVAARLLVVEKGKADNQKAEVTVAHEALFEHWTALKDLLLAARDDLILPRARVAASHKRWLAVNQDASYLLQPGKQLSEAVQLLEEYGEELTPELKAYVAASKAQAYAQQKRRQRLLVGALLLFALLAVGASAAAFFGFWQKGEAEKQASQANVSSARYSAEVGNDNQALAYLAKALQLNEKNYEAAALTAALLTQGSWAVSLPGSMYHDASSIPVQFSPDGQRVVTASNDQTAQLWDGVTGKPIGEPMKHGDKVNSARFSPDGQRIITVSANSEYQMDTLGQGTKILGGGATVRLWDAVTGKPIGEPMKHWRAVNSAQFSPDSQRVVTASNNGTARLWSAVTADPIGEPMKHGDVVYSAQFSPDGQRVVTASNDGTARLWDGLTGKAIGEPMKHEGAVISAQFSPDGQRVVTASWDGTARLWDGLTSKAIGEPMKHGKRVTSAQFSPDGRWILSVSYKDETVRLWDGETAKSVGEPMEHGDAVYSAEFSPDSQRVVTISYGTVRLWDGETAKSVGGLVEHVASVQFSPDGQRVVTVSEGEEGDGTARLWDAVTANPIGEPMKHGKRVTSAQFSPDGQRVVTASWDGTARLWDAATAKLISEPLKHGGRLESAQFSPDGQRVVTVSEGDGTARLWDAVTAKPINEPMKHKEAVISARFSPDGRRVLTVSGENKTVRLWDGLTGKPIGEPLKQGSWADFVAFSPDGQRVVTASNDRMAQLWDAATGKPIGEPLKHEGAVISAQFSPNGQRVVTASDDKTARLWDAVTADPIGEPMKNEGAVISARFSPDGRRILTASNASKARLWDTVTGKPIGKPMWHWEDRVRAEFSSDGGQRILTASGSLAKLWDGESGEQIGEPMEHEEAVNSAQFSPDGQRVVTASDDKTARLWDALNGKPIGEPMRHEGVVNSAQFSPDGQRVVTASEDGTARLWDGFTGKSIGEPIKHERGINSVHFSPDGQLINSVQFSPDGRRIMTISEGAQLWDAATGKAIGEPIEHEGAINSAQFSPDGQRLVTASNDKTARLWDAVTAKLIGEPIKHEEAVNSAQFSPDGQRVVTASTDRTAQLWDVPSSSSKDSVDDVRLLADLAEVIGGVALQISGQSEILNVLTPEEIQRTRDKIAVRFTGTSSILTPLQRFLKWSVSERRSRTISPFSELTFREWVENRINEGTLDGLRDAILIDPANARLAAHFGRHLADYALENGTDPGEVRRARGEADFQTRRGLKLAPDNEEVKALRAEVVKVLQLPE